MDFSVNFEPRCTEQEATKIAQLITIDVDKAAYDCYCYAFKNEKITDTDFKIHSALDAVYMMGFLSGCRAIRERQRSKGGQA